MSPGQDAHGHSGLDEMECLVPHRKTYFTTSYIGHFVPAWISENIKSQLPIQMTDPEERFR